MFAALVAAVLAGGPVASAKSPSLHVPTAGLQGIHKIKHVVIIMQENRSFDQYFGTYPGADGIPGVAGNPGTVPCIPDPQSQTGCDAPFHDTNDVNYGGPHSYAAANGDIDNGAMDGFVVQKGQSPQCQKPNQPACSQGATVDVMGYHTGDDIPNYWAYAQNFVLQDHMFEPVPSWSEPSHLYTVSNWSATCDTTTASCVNDPARPGYPTSSTRYRWTDITYLLHKAGVSWRYYVFTGSEPDCAQDQLITCNLTSGGGQTAKTPSIWNPLPDFTTVRKDNQLGNMESISYFFSDAKAGSLPAVSWVIPSGIVSEHPP